MYRMDAVLSLILLVSEMLKISGAKVDAHFFEQLPFVIKKCLIQDVSKNVQGQQKSFQNTQQYANSYFPKFSYYLNYSTKLSW